MSRTSWKCLLIGAVVAVAVSVAVPQANACGRRCCSWGWGYYGGCGTCYTGCSPCYGWTGCCGSYLASDWYLAARPCRYAPCRSYGCGWGCGYRCGYSCGCGYAYGYSPCCGETSMTGSVPAEGTQTPTPAKRPMMEPPSAPTPAEPAPGALPGPTPPPKTSEFSTENSGVLTVWVPYDAKVTVNGRRPRAPAADASSFRTV